MFSFTDRLLDAFHALTTAARGYDPSEVEVGFPQLADAAVRFTAQIAIDVAAYDQGQARDLESALIVKLAAWIDAEGARVLRLWTHDMSCVIGGLARAAHHFSHPQPGKDLMRYVLEIRPRNLAVAAVAFTIQLALEETESPLVAMRELESTLIRRLEEPWEFEIPLSVDAGAGPSWDALAEKEVSE